MMIFIFRCRGCGQCG